MTDDDMINCWRINYGLDKRTPEEAHRWWNDTLGHAPSGAVGALGLCIGEIFRLRQLPGVARSDALWSECSRLRAAMLRIAEMETDWTIGADENLERARREAEAGLLGPPDER